jgi:PPE-repeat protein
MFWNEECAALDFAILPPEINSGRMYAGPGSGPMLAAAQAWNGLAEELYASAGAYQSVVSELTDSWSGPSSVAMSGAAMSYVSWLSSAAAQAEQTAAQANAAAAAYETAYMSTVPPPVVAANRSLLMTLVATNFLGQNTSAIAATEAEYAEMWAQDAAAMYGYAGWSAAATTLTPFTAPQQNTDPGGASSQTDVVRQALTTSAGNAQNTVSTVSQTFSAVPDALQSFATAAPGAGPPSSSLNALSELITIFLGTPDALAGLGASLPLAIMAGPVDFPFALSGYLNGTHADDILSGWAGQESWPGNGPAPITELPAPLRYPPPGMLSAGLGGANTVGGLSVPSSWTGAAPEIRPLALTLPPVTAASPMEAGSASTVNDMGLGGMAGQAMAGPPEAAGGSQSGKAVTRPGGVARATRAAADGESKESQHNPRIVVTGVAAAIREITKLRDQGSLTHEEFLEQRNRLLGR